MISGELQSEDVPPEGKPSVGNVAGRAGVRDLSITMTSRVLVLILGLALQSCLAHFLEPAGRGSYAVCLMYTMLLAVICTCGVDGAGQYHVASGKMSVAEGVSNLLFLLVCGAIVACVAGVALTYTQLAFFSQASESSFLLAVASVPFQMIYAALLLVLTAKREFLLHAGAVVVQAGLRLTLTVFLVKGMALGVLGAVGAHFTSSCISTCLAIYLLRSRLGYHWIRPSWRNARKLLQYGGRYYFAAFSTLANFQVGVLAMAFFASNEEIGLFQAGVTLITYVVILSDVIGGVIHPRIASDPAGRPALAAQAARLVGFACGLVVVGIVVFAKPLVWLLLSSKFMPVVPVLWILAPGVVFRAGTKVLIHYLNATDHPGAFSISTIVMMVTNIALLVILLPRLGLNGAAIAMCCSYFTGGVVLLVFFRKHSGLKFRETWMPQRADVVLLAGIYSRMRRSVR